MRLISLITSLFVVTLLVGCSGSASENQDWSARFLVFNNDMYVVTEDIVEEADLNEEIGEVEEYSDVEVDAKPDTVFSNLFNEGTKIYSIKGIEQADFLAVKTDEKIYKLKNSGKYGK